MNHMEKAFALMPSSLGQELRALGNAGIEEIRIRIGRKPTVLMNGSEMRFSAKEIDRDDIRWIIEKATGASYHMAEHSINEGYINYYGLRIGVCGLMAMQKNGQCSMSRIDYLAIRIPREHRGVCKELLDEMFCDVFKSTLIISPPGGGKTSLLRETCRVLSDRGNRVGVVDERNELLASFGEQGFDLGEHTDIISSIPKVNGCVMLLRSMNPQIIAMDEITKCDDVDVISQLAGCGIKILATAHASDVNDLIKRPLYKQMLDLHVFENVIRISGKGKERVYSAERIKI